MKTRKEGVAAVLLLSLITLTSLLMGANSGKRLELLAMFDPGQYQQPGSLELNADKAAAFFHSPEDCVVSMEIDDDTRRIVVKCTEFKDEFAFILPKDACVRLSSDKKSISVTKDERTYRVVAFSLSETGQPSLFTGTVQYSMRGKLSGDLLLQDFQQAIERLPPVGTHYWVWIQ